MLLELDQQQRDMILADAALRAPEECCGILVGVSAGRRVRTVRVLPVDNVAEGDRRRRYLVDPRAQLAAHRESRLEGLAVVGYYHSHPAGDARPSAHDREHAWPDTIYVIAAPAADPPLRAWRLDASSAAFEEIGLITPPEAPTTTDDPS